MRMRARRTRRKTYYCFEGRATESHHHRRTPLRSLAKVEDDDAERRSGCSGSGADCGAPAPGVEREASSPKSIKSPSRSPVGGCSALGGGALRGAAFSTAGRGTVTGAAARAPLARAPLRWKRPAGGGGAVFAIPRGPLRTPSEDASRAMGGLFMIGLREPESGEPDLARVRIRVRARARARVRVWVRVRVGLRSGLGG